MEKRFKAVDKYTQRVVYGSYLYNPCSQEHYIVEFNSPKNFYTYEVYGDTVKQLVGKDCLGENIYESDVVVDDEGYEYTANLESNLDLEFYSKKESDFTVAYDKNNRPLSIGDLVKFTREEYNQTYTAYGTVVGSKVRYRNLNNDICYFPIIPSNIFEKVEL